MQRLPQFSVGLAKTSSRLRALSLAADVKKYDIAVVGGGIVGVATARELKQQYPNKSIVVLEKENDLALHQTGRNSGVIHCGIYYKPKSLKATLCVQGAEMMYQFCDKNKIKYNRIGKLIVAVTEEEEKELAALYERGCENKVPGLTMIDKEKLMQMEPYCQGNKAIHCPSTGIVDYKQVTLALAREFESLGGVIKTNHHVADFISKNNDKDFSSGVVVTFKDRTNTQPLHADYVITCAGVYADRMAMASGGREDPKIVPFRGEYLILSEEKRYLVKSNIYPVPDRRVPFLGVHFTPRVDGAMWLGPNAVLAFAREGYNYTDVKIEDVIDYVKYGGLWRMAIKYMAYGAQQYYRGIFPSAQLKELARFIPGITSKDIKRGPAGIRAQAIDTEGNMVDDFVFDSGCGSSQGRLLHVRNAPSPAATSSLAIAKVVAQQATSNFKLNV